MDRIASVTEQNASGVQQLSASIEQQSASNQQIASVASELLSLSDELQKLTGGAMPKFTATKPKNRMNSDESLNDQREVQEVKTEPKITHDVSQGTTKVL